MSVFASAMVHRICATTWSVNYDMILIHYSLSLSPYSLIFSLVALYYLNKISNNVASPSTTAYNVAPPQSSGRGKPHPSTPKAQNKNKRR